MHKTLTYFATGASRTGEPRTVAISLPFVSAIAGKKHYQPPPAPPTPSFPGERRAPAMTERRIRLALGREPERPDPQFDAVMARIRVEGA